MPEVNCNTYHRGIDGYYHTTPMEGAKKAEKHPKKQLSERAVRCAAKRESDAEVCRACTKIVCKGSPRCIDKERARQERERNHESDE